MFDISIAHLAHISIHHLDHEGPDPEVTLTSRPLSLQEEEEKVITLLHQYTLRPFFNFKDYQSFIHHDNESTPNEMAHIIKNFFAQETSFHDMSQKVALLLGQHSTHHSIKSGDLIIGHVKDVSYDDEVIEAIGIWKSENKEDFLKLLRHGETYEVQADRGIQMNKLDKGCIIFNTAAGAGYVVASIDRTNTYDDARYWNDQFLSIKPLDATFYETQQYLNMAQTYVKERITEDVDINKGEQLSILNDAGAFFKNNSNYNQPQFEQEVLGGNEQIIDSFQKYKQEYAREQQVELPEQFGISNLAVRRNAGGFKSVLKLDKNFHVYIHGDRKMIEHGTDDNGRKFYKLFYEEEH